MEKVYWNGKFRKIAENNLYVWSKIKTLSQSKGGQGVFPFLVFINS